MSSQDLLAEQAPASNISAAEPVTELIDKTTVAEPEPEPVENNDDHANGSLTSDPAPASETSITESIPAQATASDIAVTVPLPESPSAIQTSAADSTPEQAPVSDIAVTVPLPEFPLDSQTSVAETSSELTPASHFSITETSLEPESAAEASNTDTASEPATAQESSAKESTSESVSTVETSVIKTTAEPATVEETSTTNSTSATETSDTEAASEVAMASETSVTAPTLESNDTPTGAVLQLSSSEDEHQTDSESDGSPETPRQSTVVFTSVDQTIPQLVQRSEDTSLQTYREIPASSGSFARPTVDETSVEQTTPQPAQRIQTRASRVFHLYSDDEHETSSESALSEASCHSRVPESPAVLRRVTAVVDLRSLTNYPPVPRVNTGVNPSPPPSDDDELDEVCREAEIAARAVAQVNEQARSFEDTPIPAATPVQRSPIIDTASSFASEPTWSFANLDKPAVTPEQEQEQGQTNTQSAPARQVLDVIEEESTNNDASDDVVEATAQSIDEGEPLDVYDVSNEMPHTQNLDAVASAIYAQDNASRSSLHQDLAEQFTEAQILLDESLLSEEEPEEDDEEPCGHLAPMSLLNDDIVRIDAPRRVNPLFPRRGQVTNPAPPPSSSGGVSFSGVVAAVVAGGAPAQEEGEEVEEEDEEEEEVGADLNEVEPAVAVRVRTGLAQLSAVAVEVDNLDVAIPRGEGRGHLAAVRARAELLLANQEIRAAVGMLGRSLVDARGVAAEARERLGASQGDVLRVAAELIDFQIQAGTWRERALSSEVLLREAELEIASLRARLGEEDVE